jgi:hypothetical protein
MKSEILLATNPDNPVIIGTISKTVEEKATQLPKPSGYHILCAIPEKEKEFESGIIKADSTLQFEEMLTTVLFVVAIGPDCYKDPAKFPTGAWCNVGDFILVRARHPQPA